MRLGRAHRAAFFIFILAAAAMMAGFGEAKGSDDFVLAVDRSSLIKAIGFCMLGVLAEIWRNQRALYKITSAHAEELKELKGYCKGRNGTCGE